MAGKGEVAGKPGTLGPLNRPVAFPAWHRASQAWFRTESPAGFQRHFPAVRSQAFVVGAFGR